MTQIFNAKTVEEARALAAKAYGVSESEITFEVLEEPKKTLFGLLSTGEARVRATYRAAGDEEIVPPVVDYGEVKEDGSPALEADAPAEEAAKEEAPAEEEAPVEEAPAETVETEEVAASEEEYPRSWMSRNTPRYPMHRSLRRSQPPRRRLLHRRPPLPKHRRRLLKKLLPRRSPCSRTRI